MIDTSARKLTDREVRALPFVTPESGKQQYKIRDTELKGFLVQIGHGAKSYRIETEVQELGQRRVIKKTIGRSDAISVRDARAKARELIGGYQTGSVSQVSNEVTLQRAWDRYEESHLRRQGRSPKTIKEYRRYIDDHLADWKEIPLRELTENMDLVAERHDKLTRERGATSANHAMRTLRAVYRYARKRLDRSLPAEHPATAVDFNPERRRNTGMGLEELEDWGKQLLRLSNPVRREFHLFTLLSGSRPGALICAKWEDLDVKERKLHIPKPKGGEDRAFDIPLSRAMLRSLWRVRKAGRMLHPDQAAYWIFPDATQSGHISEYKEPRDKLSKWGGDLRQTYRTVGQVIGIDGTDMHLLMNHKLSGVNAGYITSAVMTDHLLEQQEKISLAISDTFELNTMPRSALDLETTSCTADQKGAETRRLTAR